MIFLDYEQYYEARFGKAPKVVKKVEDKCRIMLIKPLMINSTGTAKVPEGQPPSVPPNKRIFVAIQLISRRKTQ